jgi:glycosyltransferase involved in cell wall biosynthesis
MDVFILPSYREGFPTVVLEASAMQLPVITTAKTGCIDSIINGRTGIFTEINAEGIFNAIKYYLENPNIAERHGLAGRRFVQDNFRQEVIWKEIEEKVLNNIF